MNRLTRFFMLIFKDIAKVGGVILFFYGCWHFSDFVETFPNFTLYTLVTCMIVCVLGLFGTWIKTEWDNSKQEDKVKTKSVITEGKVKLGGVKNYPTTLRPAAPKGEGHSPFSG